MDELEILRNSDDPVVRHIAIHNEGYIIEEVLQWAEAYAAFWSSWRGIFIMSIPGLGTLLLLFLFIWIKSVMG